MGFGRAVKRKIKAALAPSFFLALVAYFIWNTNQGEHGRRTYSAQLGLLAQAQAEQAAAKAEQAMWQRRVDGMRDKAIDSDTLDERSRAMLNLARPDEIVVPYEKPLY